MNDKQVASITREANKIEKKLNGILKSIDGTTISYGKWIDIKKDIIKSGLFLITESLGSVAVKKASTKGVRNNSYIYRFKTEVVNSITERLREYDTTDIPIALWNELLADMNKTKSYRITKSEVEGLCYKVKARGVEGIFYIGIVEEEKETKEQVNHPSHYGGADNPYEAIKVIKAWGANFCVGNCLKYLSRSGKKDKNGKDNTIEDMKKALWYLQYEISELENKQSEKK